MEKKYIILLSIIVTLIYLTLDYLGFIRYLELYHSSPLKYIQHYKNLDKINKHNRVIIALTTTPENIKKITPTIISLLDQTVQINLISICIPYGSDYKLPIELKDSVTIFRCGKDYNILNPILSSITREEESTTQFIILNDTTIYGKNFIETLLIESEKYPNNIIQTGKGNIKLQHGTLFKTNFFDEQFIPSGNVIINNYSDANDYTNNYFKLNKEHQIININYSENYNTINR